MEGGGERERADISGKMSVEPSPMPVSTTGWLVVGPAWLNAVVGPAWLSVVVGPAWLSVVVGPSVVAGPAWLSKITGSACVPAWLSVGPTWLSVVAWLNTFVEPALGVVGPVTRVVCGEATPSPAEGLGWTGGRGWVGGLPWSDVAAAMVLVVLVNECCSCRSGARLSRSSCGISNWNGRGL